MVTFLARPLICVSIRVEEWKYRESRKQTSYIVRNLDVKGSEPYNLFIAVSEVM